jgi:hypothetical protein
VLTPDLTLALGWTIAVLGLLCLAEIFRYARRTGALVWPGWPEVARRMTVDAEQEAGDSA